MIECNCKSYNLSNTGIIPEDVLKIPEFLIGVLNRHQDTLCVDSCITKNILLLWENEIITLESCCGHGILEPVLIIGNDYRAKPIKEIRALLLTVDDREWDILQWRLVRV